MSTSMSYLYHILCNTLIFSMVYFRGGKVNNNNKFIDHEEDSILCTRSHNAGSDFV